MNAESARVLARFLGGGGAGEDRAGGSSGTDELQALLLQISLAVMMVFVIAYFMFRADASREKAEQVLEIQRQKLVAAADAVRASRRARYGLQMLVPDGPGGADGASAGFDPDLVLRDGRLVEVPALRQAFAGGLSAAAADFADPLRLRREWISEIEAAAGVDSDAVSAENARWLGARAEADIAAAESAALGVGRGAAAALQRRWTSHPDEIGDAAVSAILEKFQSADEAGRLLLVTDLSDALRARGVAAVAEMAGSRRVAAFLAGPGADAGTPAEDEGETGP